MGKYSKTVDDLQYRVDFIVTLCDGVITLTNCNKIVYNIIAIYWCISISPCMTSYDYTR